MATLASPDAVGVFTVIEPVMQVMTREQLQAYVADELHSPRILFDLAERKNAYVQRQPHAEWLSAEDLRDGAWMPIDSDAIDYTYEAGLNPPGIDDGPRAFGSLAGLVDYLIDLPDAIAEDSPPD